MKSASLDRKSRALRRPWYAFWSLIQSRLYSGREYTLSVPYGQRVFTPWFSTRPNSDFAKAMRLVRTSGPLVVSPDRCFMLYQLCRRALYVPGHAAECGVFTGGTANLLAIVLSSSLEVKTLHLFDTFTGMPQISSAKRDYHSPGDFSETSLDFVRRRLKRYPFIEYHVGVIPKTFTEVKSIANYAFVHIDVDIYPSMIECCRWFWQRLSPGGVIVFDDYGFYPYRYAAKAAVDKFFANMDHQLVILPTGQAFAIKG